MAAVTSLLPVQNHLGLGHKYMDHKLCTAPRKSLDGLQPAGQLRLHLAHSACTKCSSHSHSCSETWTAEMLCMLWR